MNYSYRALNNKTGEKHEGKYEAESKEEVIAYIVGNGYYPLLVEEVIQSQEIKIKRNKKVKTKDISIFARQFYTMLNAGVPILECLNIMSKQIENQTLRTAIEEMSSDVSKGVLLSESMKKHKNVFPELFINLVVSGEASGRLDVVMLRMANYYEKEAKTANKVKSAMIYPSVLAVVSVVAVVFILTYVMPTFVGVFEDTGTELPWNTKLLLAMSEALQQQWYIIFPAVGILIFGIVYYFRTEKGSYVYSSLQLKLPFIKKLNMMRIVSQFTRTMSTLIGSGISLIDCIGIVKDIIPNKIIKDALSTVNEKISRGEGLNSAMVDTQRFPNMLCSMIKIGEETGNLDDILNKTADFYDEELDTTIQTSVAMMEPAMIVVLGLIIGFIVISIMLPMFDMYTQI